jgi:hypothetical protein
MIKHNTPPKRKGYAKTKVKPVKYRLTYWSPTQDSNYSFNSVEELGAKIQELGGPEMSRDSLYAGGELKIGDRFWSWIRTN